MPILGTFRMRKSIKQSQDRIQHMGILEIAYVHNLELTMDNTAAGIAVVSRAVIPRAILCCAFITAKLGMMKGIEVLKIVYITAKLWNGVICDETLMICITADLRDAIVQGDELGM